ncbi:hypothetical protein VQH23_05690 [Pararoseomonas sp. SCSIO 73927]|uniref:hypothetical protein n=1 Tax=Pararoseomonas sp. SCSIO 73927 TaxID=3114537 RepID=UPI0030CE8346
MWYSRSVLAGIAGAALMTSLVACSNPDTSVPSATPNRTTGQQTRDALDPARGPAEAAGRAIDRANNPSRP